MFDMGSCDNADLAPLLVDKAMQHGHPYTCALFVWAMVNKEFRDTVQNRLAPVMEAITTSFRLWRSTRITNFKQENDARGALLHALARLLDGSACLHTIQAVQRRTDQEQLESYITRTVLAHVCQHLCMACSGVGKRCVHSPNSSWYVDDGGWQFKYSNTLLYAKASCCRSKSVSTTFLGGIPLVPNTKLLDGNNLCSNQKLARAMLHQKNIYDQSELLKMKTSWTLATGRLMPLLFLSLNTHIPPVHTLQGRLGLTDAEMKDSVAECDRQLNMKEEEARVVQQQRLAKFRLDIDAFLARRAPGETLGTLSPKFPTLHASLERLLIHSDRRKDTHPDAMEFSDVRTLVQRVAHAVCDIVPNDILYMGEARRHSPQAYEYVCNTTMGAFEGECGKWRTLLDSPPPDRAWSTVERIKIDYTICVLEIFDNLVSGKWQLTVPDKEELHWVLVCCDKSIKIRGTFDFGCYSHLTKWHDMVTSCFCNSTKDGGDGAALLPRKPPSRTLWERSHTASLLSGISPPATRDAIDKCRAYFAEMCRLCTLFPATRHAGLLFAGIRPTEVAKALFCYHDDWASGRLDRKDLCPKLSIDFVLWLTDNPRNLPVKLCEVKLVSILKNGKRPRLGPYGAPRNEGRDSRLGDDASSDSENICASYQPSSPAYSPCDGSDANDVNDSDGSGGSGGNGNKLRTVATAPYIYSTNAGRKWGIVVVD